MLWVIAAGFLLYCVLDGRRTRSPLGVVLFLGGALAYFNEPIDDVLGLVHHPRPGQNVVLETLGPVPMWGLPTYIIFFGAITYVFLRQIQQRGFTLKAFWQGMAITWVMDFMVEIPLLYADGGLYQYYSHGSLPLEVARLPLYWLFINTTGPILCAAILYALPRYFRGWRAPFLLLLPLMCDSACSIVVGLPVYSALHAPEATDAVRWGAGLLSCAIGIFLLDAFSRWILHTAGRRELETLQRLDATQPAAEPLLAA